MIDDLLLQEIYSLREQIKIMSMIGNLMNIVVNQPNKVIKVDYFSRQGWLVWDYVANFFRENRN